MTYYIDILFPLDGLGEGRLGGGPPRKQTYPLLFDVFGLRALRCLGFRVLRFDQMVKDPRLTRDAFPLQGETTKWQRIHVITRQPPGGGPESAGRKASDQTFADIAHGGKYPQSTR